MKKEERVQRMRRRLIGLEGPLDEAQWHEVDRALSGTAAYTFSMTSLLLQLSLIWDAYSHQRVTVSFGTMALFALLMGQGLFAWWGIRGNKALRQPPSFLSIWKARYAQRRQRMSYIPTLEIGSN